MVTFVRLQAYLYFCAAVHTASQEGIRPELSDQEHQLLFMSFLLHGTLSHRIGRTFTRMCAY